MTYYPSISAIQLKEKSSLKWNVAPLSIAGFKKYPNRSSYCGPICDNMYVAVAPNGKSKHSIGYFQFGVGLASFPRDISRIKFMVNIKAILEDEQFEEKYEKDLHHDCDRGYYVSGARGFLNTKLTNKLSLEATMLIMEMYDMNDNFVPKDDQGQAILKLPCPIDLFPQIGLTPGRIDDFSRFFHQDSHIMSTQLLATRLWLSFLSNSVCFLQAFHPSIHPFISLTPCLSLRAHTQILSLFLINKHPAPPKSDYSEPPG